MNLDLDARSFDLEDTERSARSRHRAIPRSSEVVGFAPPVPPYLCYSRAGRWRTRHELDRDDRCIFCDRRLA